MSAPAAIHDIAFYAWPALVAAGGAGLGLVVQRLVLPRLAPLAHPWRIADELIYAIKWPLVVWAFLTGARIALRMLTLPAREEDILATVVLVLGEFSVTWAAARFAAAAIGNAVARHGLTGGSLLAAIARVVVFIVGLLVVLQTLGIQVGPIIGALGVGGLAVGLALQDTLANFFAGVRILLAHKIHAGDNVRLDSGQEGRVEEVGWGLTTIRQLNGNLVIVPNNKLATSVTILLAPTKDVAAVFSVAHGSNLEAVEQLALAAARETLGAMPEADGSFTPAVRFTEFRDTGIRVTALLRVRPGQEPVPVVSDFIRRVQEKLQAAGIRTPTFGVPVDGAPR